MLFSPTKLKLSEKPEAVLCSDHSKEFTFMCLARKCPEKILCEQCAKGHYQVHPHTVHNIKEHIETICHSSFIKDTSYIFNKAKNFLASKEEVLVSIHQLQEEKECDILQAFDQLKSEISNKQHSRSCLPKVLQRIEDLPEQKTTSC